MLNSKMAYRLDFQYLNIFGSWGHFWGPRKLLFKSAKCNPFGKCTELLSRKSILEDVWENNFLLWNQMQIENILQFWDKSFDIVLFDPPYFQILVVTNYDERMGLLVVEVLEMRADVYSCDLIFVTIRVCSNLCF